MIRLQYLATGEADQRVVGLERRVRSPPTLKKKKKVILNWYRHLIGTFASNGGRSLGGREVTRRKGKRQTSDDIDNRVKAQHGIWCNLMPQQRGLIDPTLLHMVRIKPN